MKKITSVIIIFLFCFIVMSCDESSPDKRYLATSNQEELVVATNVLTAIKYYEKETSFPLQTAIYSYSAGEKDQLNIDSSGCGRTVYLGTNGYAPTSRPAMWNTTLMGPYVQGESIIPEDLGTLPDKTSKKYLKVYGLIDALMAYHCLEDAETHPFFCNELGQAGEYLLADPYTDMYKFNSGDYCSRPDAKGIDILVTQQDCEQSTPEGFVGTLLWVILFKDVPTSNAFYSTWYESTTTSLTELKPGYLPLQGKTQCTPDTDYYIAVVGCSIYLPPPWGKYGFPYMITIKGIN